MLFVEIYLFIFVIKRGKKFCDCSGTFLLSLQLLRVLRSFELTCNLFRKKALRLLIIFAFHEEACSFWSRLGISVCILRMVGYSAVFMYSLSYGDTP